jgi:hypothetical protein
LRTHGKIEEKRLRPSGLQQNYNLPGPGESASSDSDRHSFLRRRAKTFAFALLALSISGVHAQSDFCEAHVSPNDATGTYCTKPNFPIFGTPTRALSANPKTRPGDGLHLEPSTANLFSLVMGSAIPSANVRSGETVREFFYMNYLVGDPSQSLGSPMDTGQNGNKVFAAVARRYPVGDPNDLHLLKEDGLHLRAICSMNHTDCAPGHVYAGMIRVPAEIRPGMTIKVRYKSPAGPFSWAPIWMFTGSEKSPGPGGDPHQGTGTSMSLIQLGVSRRYFEIDLNDNFPRWYNSRAVITGKQFDYGTPHGYGAVWKTQPHPLYWAEGGGFNYHPESKPPFEELPFNWSAGFHDLVLSWQTDNLLFEFVDGKLVVVSYMEYPARTYQDGFDDNAVKTVAMHLIIGNQAIPSFAPGGEKTKENDGIQDGWTITIEEISAWSGNIADPWKHAVAANGCNQACQQIQ